MKELNREMLEHAKNYFIARIELEQPNPDPNLYQNLGEVAFQLYRIETQEEEELKQ